MVHSHVPTKRVAFASVLLVFVTVKSSDTSGAFFLEPASISHCFSAEEMRRSP